jgi:hypothetical protein
MTLKRLPPFACHPERSDCAFAIAQPKDLPPIQQPHARSNHLPAEPLQAPAQPAETRP